MTLHKFYAAFTAAVAVLAAVAADGHIDFHDAIGITAAFLGAFGVLLIPNRPTK